MSLRKELDHLSTAVCDISQGINALEVMALGLSCAKAHMRRASTHYTTICLTQARSCKNTWPPVGARYRQKTPRCCEAAGCLSF